MSEDPNWKVQRAVNEANRAALPPSAVARQVAEETAISQAMGAAMAKARAEREAAAEAAEKARLEHEDSLREKAERDYMDAAQKYFRIKGSAEAWKSVKADVLRAYREGLLNGDQAARAQKMAGGDYTL